MRIRQKGLILVLTPLAFEIIFVGVLSYLLNESEAAVLRENRARTIVSDLIRLRDLIGMINLDVSKKSVEFSLSQYDDSASGKQTAFFQTEIKAQKVLNNLSKNLKSEESSIALLKVLEREFSQWIYLQRTSIRYLSDGNEHLAKETLRASNVFSQRLLDAEMKLRRVYSSKYDANPEEKTRSVRQLNELLQAGLIASAVIALALSFFFSRSVTTRLNLLRDNTNLLGEGKALKPPVGGKDEIAELDAVFRKMAVSIDVASKREKGLTEKLETILQSIPVGLAVVTELGGIEKANGALSSLCGKDVSDLEGMSLFHLFSGKDTNRIAGLVAGKGAHAGLETRLRDFDIDVELQTASFPTPEGNRCLVVVADVTEAKRVERFRRDMVATVSHDLRSPLSTVSLSLDLIGKNHFGEISDKGKARISTSSMIIQRMANLIGDLLDSERLDSGKLELNLQLMRLDSIFAVSVDSVKDQSEAKAMTLVIEPTDLMVIADSERMVQVLVNILTNAIKFSPERACVNLSAGEEDGYCVIRVADQAGGIPRNILSTLFDPFVQSGRSDGAKRKGFGLGLSICRSIVQLHNGVIEVESEDGVGSTFIIRLPAQSSGGNLGDEMPSFPDLPEQGG